MSGVMRDQLILAELNRLAGVLDERRHIRCDEVFSLPDTDDQRRVAPSSHHRVGLLTVDRYEGERATQPAGTPLAWPPREAARLATCWPSNCATISVSVSDWQLMPAS